MSFEIINGKAYPITKNSEIITITKEKKYMQTNKFDDLLVKNTCEKQDIKVSKHATERLINNPLNKSDIEMLAESFRLLKEKGCKNSLILYKNMALITNVDNKTIITAIENSRIKKNIFTNIDSVLIL